MGGVGPQTADDQHPIKRALALEEEEEVRLNVQPTDSSLTMGDTGPQTVDDQHPTEHTMELEEEERDSPIQKVWLTVPPTDDDSSPKTGDIGPQTVDDQHPPEKTLEIEEENDSPIEQVRLTVPPTDDPSLPVLTFRAWILGVLSCLLLAFVNAFFGYRQNTYGLGSVPVQIVTLPLGRLMAATLPDYHIRMPFTKWSFSLNPGPFNQKEHVLITIFASSGANGVYALLIVTAVKAFYHRSLNFIAAFILAQTTMFLGYAWAGMLRKILVDSPYMWWPDSLVSVSLFRTLHEKESRPKGGLTRLQFFLIAFICSFSYYIVTGYFFPLLSCISIACFIWKKSVLAQQIGSGLNGLGIGSFALVTVAMRVLMIRPDGETG